MDPIISYEEYLRKIFVPLAEASNSNAQKEMKILLGMVIAIDSVDDENSESNIDISEAEQPAAWIRKQNPHYLYELFYVWVNAAAFNNLRRS